MKSILFLFFNLVFFCSTAQIQQAKNINYFINDLDNHSSRVLTSGNFIVQYNNYYTVSGSNNSIVRKLNYNLECIDSTIFTNGNKNIFINDLVNYQDEYFIAIGTKELDVSGFFEIMILKLDLNLNLIHEEYYNINIGSMDYVYHYINSEGNIIVAASVNGNPPNQGLIYLDFLFLKLGADVQVLFDTVIDYSYTEVVMDLKPINGTDKMILLCSPNFEEGSISNRFNILNEDFELIQSNYIPEREYYMSIEILDNSEYLINSRKFDQNYTPTAWFAQQRLLDSDLIEITTNIFGSPDTMMYPAQYNSIAYQDQNNIYTCYTYNLDAITYSSKISFICLSSIDENLNQDWIKYYGGDNYYYVNDICAANAGGCLITGTRYKNGSPGPFEREIFIIKVDEDGLITSTNQQQSIPIKNAIITPNPGKDYLQLHTGIFPTTLQMFDINGKMILEENINTESTSINTQSLSSGTYIWQLVKDGQVVENDKWVKE